VSETPKTDSKAQFFGFNPDEGEEFVQADFARELERENAALRAAAVEVCALARVWVTVWGDTLSQESIQRFAELEREILKGAQP
jgi:hypothetical protein